MKRTIGIVGAGIGGLHLALYLQKHGVEATIITDRAPDDYRNSRLLNTVAHHHVTIAREAYLGIEQVRFGERLRVTIDAPDALRAIPVPPLLLQPIVENAIKHGIGPIAGPVSIAVSARREGDRVRLAVADSGRGFDFAEALKKSERVEVPMVTVITQHAGTLFLGVLVSLTAFMIFYLMTVFSLSWGTSALGYSREKFLVMQLFAILFFAAFTPISALLAERGRRKMLMWVNVGIFLFGLVMAPLFEAGTAGAVAMMVLGMSLVGLVYGPLGTVLSELFPTNVRYSGSSLTFNLAGIFGASLAPYAATYLAKTYSLQYVGYYLCAGAVLSMIGLLATRETAHETL